MVRLFCLYLFSHRGFSEGALKLAMSTQQGGGRQNSCGKTKCEDPITFCTTLPWHFAVKCHFQVVFPTTHLSVYVSSHLSANPPWRMHGHYWGSEKLMVCFPSLPESAAFPGGRLLPPPFPGWSGWAVAALSPCRVLQQPWLFCAAASAASWHCLPWGIISRVEALCFPRNRKRRRAWEMGGLNNLELDYSMNSMTSAPFSLPTHWLSHGISA